MVIWGDSVNDSSLTVGIEEEYLLVDVLTRNLAEDPPKELLSDCQARHQDQVTPEFLRAQIEVATSTCTSIQGARDELRELRGTISSVASKYGLAPIAAATHPFAKWSKQKTTSKARYATLDSELKSIGRRLVTCGMHVHVGIEDPDLRIDVMNQVTYFLPHLLAFSTSSPFWDGYDTGLKSYRVSVFDGLPRTGLPETFESYAQYERFVAALVDVGIIQDSTKLWWDIRPNPKFPTLELRIADVCTRLDDGIAIAALYVCLVRMLLRLRRKNRRWRLYFQALLKENRWRSQRYGLDQGLVDFGVRKLVPWGNLVEELIGLVWSEAKEIDCVEEIEHLRTIYERGTSAHWQLQTYKQSRAGGMEHAEAMQAVVDMLLRATVSDL